MSSELKQYIINADPECRVKITRSATGGRTGIEISKAGSNLSDLAVEVRAVFDELADTYGKDTPNI